MMRASIVSVVLAAAAGAAQAQSSVVGEWSAPVGVPVVAIHMHVLPDGNVMAWGKPETPPIDGKASVRLWDPTLAQPVFHEAHNPYVDVYCAGHVFLADGRLLAVGGHIRDFVGSDVTSVFDSVSRTWSPAPRMSAGRWYPTNTTLANGDVLAVSGDVDTTIGVNRLPQVFQPATGTWRDLPDAQLSMPLYPWMHVAPNGKVFNSGPGQTTRYLDTSGAGAWTMVGLTNFGDRRQYEGASVMYEPGKVLIVGGGSPATATAEVINLNDAAPQWRYTQPMAHPRRELNATLLPDGKVLATGGSSSTLFKDPTKAVYNAEIWDPVTETWSTMAAMRTSRLYHSTAVLLPDGRVLVAGGGGDGSGGDIDHYDAEYFSPPYLFKGARPTVSAAPGAVNYGETFTVAATDPAGIADITLVALSSTTHEFNQSQRFLRLAFSPAADGSGFSVKAPAHGNLAPPGFYMLFVLNGNGVPSVARMVRVGASPDSNVPPAVNAGVDLTIALPAAANLSGAVSDDGKPGPLVTAWSQLSGPGAASFADAASANTTVSFPAAGVYALRLSASDGAATSTDDVTVTVNAKPDAGAGSGLTGQYYSGKTFEQLVLTRTDPTVDFTWGFESPGAGVPEDGFSVRWTGQVRAPVTGNYRFSTVSNDGVRLWVDGRRIINNWTVHGTTTNTSADIALQAGVRYSIKMEFFDNSGWAAARLLWAYPGQAQTAIATAQLYPAGAANTAPAVNAGADQAITLPAAASLSGTASDDGQPGALTVAWSQLSGPGAASFGNAGALNTTAAFSAAGVYVLRLTANDGALSSSDDVTVTVSAPPASSGNGLTGSYYNGINFGSLVFTRVDPTVDFTWGYDSPGAGVQVDGFSARWTGYVQAPVTGSYTFSTVSNDGVRLTVNGQRLIDNWTVHGTTTNTSAAVALVAGTKYPVTMEFFENAGWGVARLLWAYPGTPQTPIPQSQLFP